MFVVFDPNGVSKPYQVRARVDTSAVSALQAVKEVQAGKAVSSETIVDQHKKQHSPNPYQLLDIQQKAKPILYARDLMSSPVVSLSTNDSIVSAQKAFHDRKYRHMPVLNLDSYIVGIVSDRDMLRYLSVTKTVLDKEPITSVMKTNVLTAGPDADIHTIARVMFEEHIGALPVIDEQNYLIGLVTRSDILRGLLKHGPIELWG